MPDTIAEMLRQGQEDLVWFETQIDELKAKHDNQFVAFANKRILGFGDSPETLRAKLRKEGIDTTRVIIHFVSKVKTILY